MKNLIKLLIVVITSFLIVSCTQNSNKQKELELREREIVLKEKELELKEKNLLNSDSTEKKTESKLNPDESIKLVVNPQNIEGTLGQVTFQQKEKTLFYFESKSQKGKIIINGTEYVLNKLSYNSAKGSYKISGQNVTITTSNCKYDEEDGGDCTYGKFTSVSIKLNNKSTILYNIELQDCPDMDY